jgi:hypothetical protein
MPDAVFVFAEDGVADPMEPIFDVPMISPPTKQPAGVDLVAGETGDRVGGFDRLFAVANDAPRQPADLRQSGPVQPSGEPGGRLQAVASATTVPFVEGLGDLAASVMRLLRVGGKIPREIRRRTWRAVPADCL